MKEKCNFKGCDRKVAGIVGVYMPPDKDIPEIAAELEVCRFHLRIITMPIIAQEKAPEKETKTHNLHVV